MPYARSTTVSVEHSKSHIQNALRRYGADEFATMESKTDIGVFFQIDNLAIRITAPLPKLEEFVTTETGRERSEQATLTAWEQAVRQRWRALLLCIKAKLEAVETGISTFMQEFLSFVVTPRGSVGELLIPKIEQLAKTGQMPKLLPAPAAGIDQ